MDMLGRLDDILKVVLNIDNFIQKFPMMVIIDEGKSAGDFPVRIQFLPQ
jgi:hypothetical protein